MSRRHLLGAAALFLLAGAAVAVAIVEAEAPDASQPPSTARAPGETRCEVTLATDGPTLAPVAPLPPPASVLVAEAALPKEWLEQQISRRAPTTLASAKRKDIGAPGEVSYVVSRGAFSFELDGDRLWVRTPVGAQAEICKPIGPICPTYGTCTPRLGAGIGVPLMIDRLDEGARISLQVYEGCSIAGFDATPRIEAQAKQQLAGVKSTIDRAIPARKEREELLGLLARPWPLADGCLAVTPKRLVQAPPELTDRLSLRFALEGTVARGSCDAVTPTIAVERGTIDGGEVAIPVAWSFDETIGAAFADAGLRFEGVRTAMHDRAAVIFSLHLDGRICGPVWVSAQPVVSGERVAFEKARLVAPTDLDDGTFAHLRARIEAIRLPLPASLRALGDELARFETVLAERSADLPPELGLTPRIEGNPPTFEVAVAPEGLRFVVRRRFRIVVSP